MAVCASGCAKQEDRDRVSFSGIATPEPARASAQTIELCDWGTRRTIERGVAV